MHPTLFTTPGLARFAQELDAERGRQLAKFGDQRHPDGTQDDAYNRTMRDAARAICEQHANRETLTWAHVLDEEYREALAETDPAKLRAELIQIAAVCAAWVSDLDRRPAVVPEPDLPDLPDLPDERDYCQACNGTVHTCVCSDLVTPRPSDL
ncbi:hypothetical protein OHA91_22890 [Streptomyces erythrochromogenes]|uniref:Uncharacterized protein n=1 Tax=Streptomyces erythrochromogenes TaxID=285574 RepID=A0ABZ1QFH4_9ACTN|nr:hypothetical protein [Streptomyces erythrochromogenes]